MGIGGAEPEAPGPTAMPPVAYFSPEFGVSEVIPQYSGGLGVLAGDYLKVCADEAQPLVGVGLFYHHGYFHQRLDQAGWQQESYRELDPSEFSFEPVAGEGIELPLGDRLLRARVWRQLVGSVPLYLLDTNVPENADDLRGITDRLYGGDIEHRLRQEILLGMGGMRALVAAGESPVLFHSNEGHAGFLILERIRHLVQDESLTFEEAVEAARAATVFTTHTPVPAGIDHFPMELMARYFQPFCDSVEIPLERLMALGHFPGQAADAPFNMAVLGLRVSGHANAVSRLHQQVSQHMFHGLWPNLFQQEVPIQAVTNGVHARQWASPEMAHLLDRYLGPRWDVHAAVDWSRLRAVSKLELWDARQPGRRRLVAEVRRRLRAAESSRGVPEEELTWTDEVLDDHALTIGFARRVAEYKRGALLFSQPERLRRLLLNPEHPVQLIIAGKAHPVDDQGKHIIQALAQAAHDPQLRRHLVFVEDYDIAVGRMLYQGADVWLNTPRRPMEACGTSGQKAALSGALNLSILDGWWDEAFDGDNGFAIPSFEEELDLGRRDHLEAEALFQLLEDQVVPRFFDRDEEGVPRGWLGMVHQSLATIVPLVLGSRMVADYIRQLYQPAAAATALAAVDRHRGARRAVAFADKVRGSWPEVSLRARGFPVRGLARPLAYGSERVVEALVRLGGLAPHEVEVQLLHGPVGADGQLIAPRVEMMSVDEGTANGHHRYLGRMALVTQGPYGFTVRVLPRRRNGDGPPAEIPVRFAEPLRLLR
ncbi:MAG: alpha-glucan family phosphorylase [Candidatus Dormibacteraeota bacterium]|nr:alpha-glucan family phosphorylase [Candidatus Dormibacteraeota bacterium]